MLSESAVRKNVARIKGMHSLKPAVQPQCFFKVLCRKNPPISRTCIHLNLHYESTYATCFGVALAPIERAVLNNAAHIKDVYPLTPQCVSNPHRTLWCGPSAFWRLTAEECIPKKRLQVRTAEINFPLNGFRWERLESRPQNNTLGERAVRGVSSFAWSDVFFLFVFPSS